MRGIFSLGTIGLMTGATLMIAAPTESRAVTPIDILGQRTSEFPETVLGAPTLSEDGSLLDLSGDGGPGNLPDSPDAQGDGTEAAVEVESPVTADRNVILESRLRELSGEAEEVPEAEASEAPVNGDAGDSQENSAANDSADANSGDGATDASSQTSSNASSREEIARSLRPNVSAPTNDGNDSGTGNEILETALSAPEGGENPGPESTSTETVAGGASSSQTRNRNAIGGLEELFGPRSREVAPIEEESLASPDDGATADEGGTVESSDVPAGGAVGNAADGGNPEVEEATAVQSDPVRTRRNDYLESRLREIETGSDDTEDPTAESASPVDGTEGTSEALTETGGVDTADGPADPSVEQIAEVQTRPVRERSDDMLQSRLRKIKTVKDETEDPLAVEVQGPVREVPGPLDEVQLQPREVPEGDDGVQARAREVPTIDEMIGVRPREVAAADDMVGVQPRQVADGTDTIPTTAPREVGTADAAPRRAPQMVGGTGDAVGAVPEPATWLMMIFGFWFVAWRLRRRGAKWNQCAVPA